MFYKIVMSDKTTIPYIDLQAFEKDVLIEAGQITSSDKHAIKESKPHRHDYQTIIWTTEGQSTHNIDGQEISTATHSLCLIARGQIHHFLDVSDDFMGLRVLFTDDFLSNSSLNDSYNYKATLFNNTSLNEPLTVPSDVAAEFESIMSQLVREYENQDHFNKENSLRYLLLYLLTKVESVRRDLVSEQPDKVALSHYETYQSFISHLEEGFQTEHDVNFYADQLELSARHLSEITKKVVGKTAKQIIVNRLILEAKRHLQFTSLSVQDIAYGLGYESPYYFSQAFKNATNLSPSAYKKQL